MSPPTPRAFTIPLAQSIRFAELSGDFNPLHVDPVLARRSHFGSAVVHGVHAFLHALDQWAGERATPFSLQSVRVKFHSAIPTGSEVRWTVADRSGKLAFELRDRHGVAQRGTVQLEEPAARRGGPPTPPANRPRRAMEIAFEDSSDRSGAVDLGMDAALAAEVFPNLSHSMPARQLAGLLATTRIIGMECPGLLSLLRGIETAFHDEPGVEGDCRLHYRVIETDDRFSTVCVAVSSGVLSGRLEAMFRPAPARQESYSAVRARFRCATFAGQRVAILGGSRGLGELAAKLVAAGGGEPWISYSTGDADASGVASDITTHGGSARVFRFDVLNPPNAIPADLAGAAPPTHLYFFATPPIQFNRGGNWDCALFNHFCDFYVGGLERAIRALRSWWPAAPLTVFYPSTIYLDDPEPGAAEYAAAKSAGEALCRYIEAGDPNVRCYAARLPRMLTDQTNVPGSDAGSMPPAADVLFEALRGLPSV